MAPQNLCAAAFGISMSISDNYKRIQDEIAEAALNYGRDPAEIKLVAVTKNVDWKDVAAIYQLGQRDFGENKLQEAQGKQLLAPKDCHWHFIGTLQKNKARKAVGNFVLIHSVDSFELAAKISQCSLESGTVSHILLQSNTSGEITKHGYTAEEWKACFEDLLSLPCISIDGLMTMAPLTDDDGMISKCFAALRLLRDDLSNMSGGRANLKHLSMGMSHDFKIAIAEGATLLRIGNSIFN